MKFSVCFGENTNFGIWKLDRTAHIFCYQNRGTRSGKLKIQKILVDIGMKEIKKLFLKPMYTKLCNINSGMAKTQTKFLLV